MQNIELVKLIEGEIAKLSPEAREAWEDLDLRVQTAPLDQDPEEIMRIIEETGNPPEDEATIIAPQRTRLPSWLGTGFGSGR